MEDNKDWFQIHVVESLDRLEKGQADFQKTILEKFEDHAKDDSKQFESIRTSIATDKAVKIAEAKASAKFWAAVGGGISLLISSGVHFFTKGH